MGQKRILLGFIEAMHFIHKNQGFLRVQALCCRLSLIHCRANVFNPAQHRADGNELRIKRTGHEAGNGGFAHTWRPPKNAAVRLP